MSGHDKAIEAAYEAIRHHTQTVSDGGQMTMEGLRAGIAAFLRAESADIGPSESGPYSTYWRNVKDFLDTRVSELDGGRT